jgi:hypothetical protein
MGLWTTSGGAVDDVGHPILRWVSLPTGGPGDGGSG